MTCENCGFEQPEHWKGQFTFCPECGYDHLPDITQVKTGWRVLGFIGELLVLIYALGLIGYVFSWKSLSGTASERMVSKELAFFVTAVVPLLGFWLFRGLALLMRRPLDRFRKKYLEFKHLCRYSMDEYLDHKEGGRALKIVGWLLATAAIWSVVGLVLFNQFAALQSESFQSWIGFSTTNLWYLIAGAASGVAILIVAWTTGKRMGQAIGKYDDLTELALVHNDTPGHIAPVFVEVNRDEYEAVKAEEEAQREEEEARLAEEQAQREWEMEEARRAAEEQARAAEEEARAARESQQKTGQLKVIHPAEAAPSPTPPQPQVQTSSMRTIHGPMQGGDDTPPPRSRPSGNGKRGKKPLKRLKKRLPPSQQF